MTRLFAAALAVLALPLTGCSQDEPIREVEAAKPQVAELPWDEPATDAERTLRFRVTAFRVTTTGWEAEIAIENDTDVGWRIPAARRSALRAFGVMLFSDGKLSTLEEASRRGTTPPVRQADSTVPATPTVLDAGASWRGTISARGALPRGAWLRVSFGPFTAVGRPPQGLGRGTFSWITDHAYRLR
ncbi:MAG: hypothetical protein U0R50_10330 [Gaiellales bacterium]